MSDYTESPFGAMLSTPQKNLIRQELVTYSHQGDCIHKTVIIREFFGNDFVDSQTNIVLSPK